MTQLLSPQMIEALSSVFPLTNSPAFAWGNAISNHLMIPALHALWPGGAHHDTHVNVYLDDIACGYDLTFVNTPTLQLWDGGLPPCIRFSSLVSSYLEHADDGQFDILGTETHTLAAQRGLSMGGWFRWHSIANQQALMSKWTALGNQRSYRMYKNAAHNIVFEISNAGAAVEATVTSAGAVSVNTWHHIIARYSPAVAMDIYVDGVRTSAATAIASIKHSNAVFDVARSNAADYANIYASLVWIAAGRFWDNVAGTRDLMPFALYQHSRKLFNR